MLPFIVITTTVTMIIKYCCVALISIIATSSVVSVVAEKDCDRCKFDGNDAIDCKDYGLIDNSVLIGWPLGSEDCMGAFNIAITSQDPSIICASANSFVNELRFGSSLDTAKLGLGVSEGGFFDDGPVLKDTITIDGTTHDCDASESDCYNAMKPFFESNPDGQKEMKDVCDQLVNKVANDKQLEQGILRDRLCLEHKDGTTIPATCEPLWAQLLEQINMYPDKGCQGFAFGAQNTPIPGCEGESDSTGTDTTAPETEAAASTMTRGFQFVVPSMLLMLVA